MEKNQLILFYAIEKNTEDKYYHAHFLIDCARDMLVAEDIEDKLELICDPNSYKEGRIYIKEYDLKFDKGDLKRQCIHCETNLNLKSLNTKKK